MKNQREGDNDTIQQNIIKIKELESDLEQATIEKARLGEKIDTVSKEKDEKLKQEMDKKQNKIDGLENII